MPRLSLVIPVYNEEDNLERLHAEIAEAGTATAIRASGMKDYIRDVEAHWSTGQGCFNRFSIEYSE